MNWSAFDRLSIEQLRLRRSEKWATYPPDVLPAFVAEMDFPLADPVSRALHSAVERGDCGYAWPTDIAESFCGYAKARSGWRIDPDRVVVAPDVMLGIAEVLHLTTAPGVGVVINPPVYPPFFSSIGEMGRRIVEVPLQRAQDGRWSLDVDGLERAFADGARAYLLCNPHNPTGNVWSGDELRRVAELAAQYGVTVIADEIHAPLTLPGASHVPFLSVSEAIGISAAAVTSASKGWNIAGLKCALIVAGSPDMLRMLKTTPDETRWERVGHLGVLASIAAYRDGIEWLDALVAYLDANRALLVELLATNLPKVRYVPQHAGYLAWLDCTELGLGPDPAAVFLERGRVALARGLNFGASGASFARLNMGTSRALLTEAVERMRASL